jgi:hypothetical protein
LNAKSSVAVGWKTLFFNKMEYFEINKEVYLEINESDEVPIIIESAGSFININFNELEEIYKKAKSILK